MTTIRSEAVVVGSGAGGSVMAFRLAAAGMRVNVVERGPWLHPRQMSHDEPAMIARLYKDGGAQTNVDADMFVLQGDCVGGSTVLTNAVCFRMPESVRQSFAAHGFDLPPGELANAFDRVEGVIGVAPLPTDVHNPATWRLTDGLRRIGAPAGGFHKAMQDCIGCGYCNIGCRYGKKLDAAQTWIPMAIARGANVIPELEVVRIEHRKGHVVGLVAHERQTGQKVRIVADVYVLAGGAINTPELLLRSGLHRGRAGKRTSFNAGAIVFGEFPEPLDGWKGDQMCVHSLHDDFVIEQIQNPPVSLALTLPGFFGDHAARMRRFRHLAALGVLVPTQPTGEVYLGLGHRLVRPLFDHADIRFRMGPRDMAAFRSGCRTAAAAMLAAGARRVFVPSGTDPVIERPEDLTRIDAAMRTQTDLMGFGSSHPQGGACAGSDPRRDVVAPDFRVRGLRNLYVADASLFPHSVKVNPMLSIMAVADLAANRITGTRAQSEVTEGPAFRSRERLAGRT
ncbi:MAG: GMC family oxidoreductase [Planctomycetes bacterium]|nr:GMC family oxidoreductase [Planctomycetota bacterium]